MGGIMGMMPGMGKMKDQLAAAGLDDSMFEPPARHHLVDDQGRARQSRPAQASAARSASPPAPAPMPPRSTSCSKMHRQMADMMKAMGGKGKGGGMMRGMMGGLAGKMGLGGTRCRAWAACPICRRWIPKQLEALQKQAEAAGLGKGLPADCRARRRLARSAGRHERLPGPRRRPARASARRSEDAMND